MSRHRGVGLGFQRKSLLRLSRCFPYQIFWRPLPTYSLHSLAVNLIWDSIDNHLHFSDVRIESPLTASLTSGIAVPSLTSLEHWCPHWWLCLIPYLLRLSWVTCSHMNLFPIFVVRRGLISEFLTANDFILKLILFSSWASCVLSDPIRTLLVGASLSSKKSSSERALGKNPWSFRISRWNPIFVLINDWAYSHCQLLISSYLQHCIWSFKDQ